MGILAAVVSAGLTLLPWVGFDYFKEPRVHWNGLGIYVGEYPGILGSDIGVTKSAGWIILAPSIASAVFLVGGTWLRLLNFVARACALVAFVTALSCLASPALIVSEVRESFGMDARLDRYLLNSSVLIVEVAITGLLSVCAIYGGRRRSVGVTGK
ncbi:hypothetical protein A5634_15860 [Mycobacterium asiaticum]|uniref:Uncharacterized protein n=1 Tax=Mycobacterium asiaticum TaxID=1790 RepID=A0A1A3PD74_MYCAS|nr:hypothetical protein [Mycobacterium asiaticum]OBK30547.1 hypothetical protein A5634_15860 [Mycobacterium asiaticum]